MAFNKNFVVKNGIEIATDLIYATNDLDKVGLGTTVPASKLDVIGDVTAYGNVTADGGGLRGGSANITGIGTIIEQFNVGTGGTALKVTVGSAASVGINTNKPSYPLDVRGAASIGQTAAYFYGDLVVTGNLSGNSFDGSVSLGSTLSVTDLNITGILTAKDSEVYTQFDVINNGSAAYQYQSTGIGFTVNRDDPAIFLIRGKQYRFNVNATGYPFYIKTAATTGTGDRFDRGVQNNGAQVGIITFRVPFDAPRTLYYQASNQAGMGSTIYVLKESEPLPTGLSTVQTTVQYLNVTGFATAANLEVTGLATVTGPALFTETLSANQLTVSGVGTFGNRINLDSTAIYFNLPDTNIDNYYSGGKINLQSEYGAIIRGGAGIAASFNPYQGVKLYHSNSQKFETIGAGVTVTGTTFTNQLNVSGVSTFAGITTVTGQTLFSKQLNVSGVSTFGSASDLTISYFDSIDTNFIYSDEHDLFIGTKAETGGSTNYIALVGIHTGNDAYSSNTSSVSLRYGNSETKLQTIGTGVTVTGTVFTNQLNVSGVSTFGNRINASSRITVGTGVTIDGGATGNAIFAGIVTATSFVGDGSGLTGAGATVADDTSTNSSFYPLFTEITSGTVTGTKISTTKLTFNPSTGTLTATDLNSSSDSSLKENIETIEDALSTTNNLRGVKFNWKEDGRPSYGVIAQEIEKILPELVNTADHKTVNYNGIIGVLIEAVKELSDRVEMLEGKLYK